MRHVGQEPMGFKWMTHYKDSPGHKLQKGERQLKTRELWRRIRGKRTIHLPDGSLIIFEKIRRAPNWAEGRRKYAYIRLPTGQLGPRVLLYFKGRTLRSVWTIIPRVRIYDSGDWIPISKLEVKA